MVLRIRAVLFDLYGTLTYVENPVSDQEASDFLLSSGYEVSPQQFKASWAFVAFVDYPRYGYGGSRSFLRRVLLDGNSLYAAITKYAKRLGYHNPKSQRLEDHFGPHCFRHWFTTWLLRNGMPREYIKELRGDKRKEAIDIYHHIDKQELRKTYLACIPKLGI